LTEQSWSQVHSPSDRTIDAVRSFAGGNVNPPVNNTIPPDNRAAYRGWERPADPRTLQADNRNDPAAHFATRNVQYDYRGNPIDAPVRRDIPAGVPFSRDAGSNYPPASAQGSPLMPSNVQGPAANYRDPQISEPGVARFDGSITPPPVRTSYDRAGSSNN
jgi:hypothetical protein